MPEFSQSSFDKLSTCHNDLIHLCMAVVRYYDIKILHGYRDEATQNELYRSGASKKLYPESKHNERPSMAVDISPYPIPHKWGEEWKDRVKFYELKAIMFYQAAQMGVRLRWGGDWDGDNDYKDQTFDDLVHYELIR